VGSLRAAEADPSFKGATAVVVVLRTVLALVSAIEIGAFLIGANRGDEQR
jgi:hypothetical protein